MILTHKEWWFNHIFEQVFNGIQQVIAGRTATFQCFKPEQTKAIPKWFVSTENEIFILFHNFFFLSILHVSQPYDFQQNISKYISFERDVARKYHHCDSHACHLASLRDAIEHVQPLSSYHDLLIGRKAVQLRCRMKTIEFNKYNTLIDLYACLLAFGCLFASQGPSIQWIFKQIFKNRKNG